MERVYNFNPGPAVLPLEVLQQAQQELVEYADFGMSLLENGLDGLAGHRSVRGMRASIYNAVPEEACRTLADFMIDFQKQNG